MITALAGHAGALRHCVTSRKVAGSGPNDVKDFYQVT
jgi:hypothetical protein